MAARRMALVFDLDGTLVDSVYQHVVAWHHALLEEGIELSIWRHQSRPPSMATRSCHRDRPSAARRSRISAAAAAPSWRE